MPKHFYRLPREPIFYVQDVRYAAQDKDVRERLCQDVRYAAKDKDVRERLCQDVRYAAKDKDVRERRWSGRTLCRAGGAA
jgi:hypothetical protein